MLVKHLRVALKVNRLVQDWEDKGATQEDRAAFSALVDLQGNVLSAQEGFLSACRKQRKQFDDRRLPGPAMRQLMGAGQGLCRGQAVTLHARRLGDVLWLRASARMTADPLPPRRMDVATLFVGGFPTKRSPECWKCRLRQCEIRSALAIGSDCRYALRPARRPPNHDLVLAGELEAQQLKQFLPAKIELRFSQRQYRRERAELEVSVGRNGQVLLWRSLERQTDVASSLARRLIAGASQGSRQFQASDVAR